MSFYRLLDVLAARKDPHGLSGDVLVNGAPRPANFKCNSGYVVQDDVVMGTLTVRENLQFSVALRLPTTTTNHEKNERINKVIEELGLSKVADSKVMMSKQGRTIIFSIHQPRYSIFKLFDSLALLASGELMFHGPAQEALGYFESADYHWEPYNNPADFFLNVINGDSSAVVLNRKKEKPVIEKLAEFYTSSSFCRDTKAELDQLSGDQKKKRSSAFREITYVTSFCHQLRWITKRSFKNLLGNPQASIAQILVTTILALVIGAIYFGLSIDSIGIQNRAGVLFFLTINQCFSSVSAMELFVVEKKLFIHEYISGYYRVSSYFFGKLFSDLLPMRLLPSVIFTCILYFMIGLKAQADAFFIMMFTLIMVAYAASSMGLAIAAGQSVVSVATLFMTISFVFMMALQYNEFLGQNFCPGFSTTENEFAICTGEAHLTNQGIDLSPWGLWKDHVSRIVKVTGMDAVNVSSSSWGCLYGPDFPGNQTSQQLGGKMIMCNNRMIVPDVCGV
ncbi:ATP-binding cassette sub-family G member 2 [Sciurus carolinensis]|uniref:ABC-type xenobiotic transporter n=1 Tax=Sciurus carolinensis TaxID=30640 RepID=A0AA41MVZ4_SCICA|nr:ATP-binding cassette sub-family G member 2 [Sciurus carolinensis]